MVLQGARPEEMRLCWVTLILTKMVALPQVHIISTRHGVILLVEFLFIELYVSIGNV
jgi:hypothetical protein